MIILMTAKENSSNPLKTVYCQTHLHDLPFSVDLEKEQEQKVITFSS